MLSVSDWDALDAVGLGELVRKGEVSCKEVIETAIARIETLNPVINAVVVSRFDESLEEAAIASSDGLFSGVPYLLKDLHAPAKGLPLTNASRLFSTYRPNFDSSLVQRLRDAGFILLGRTNTPEFGLSASTEPRVFGPTRNPWNLDRSAGGSSGGSGAAVASGMLPAAHATDSGGSLRIPAACNGLVGLKPTRGLNPAGPHRGEANHGISHENVVTRTVRDSAAILDVTAGPDAGAPYFTPPPPAGFVNALGQSLRPLRIAFTSRTFAGASIDPEVQATVVQAAKRLADMGHVVEEAAPSFESHTLEQAVFALLFANLAKSVSDWERARGRLLEADEVEPVSLASIERGRAMTLPEYIGALATMHSEGRKIGAFFDTYDVLVTPVLAGDVPMLGSMSMDTTDLDGYLERLFATIPFTIPFNATGLPAISLPIGQSRSGMPIGVQFVGRFGQDAQLLTLAARLEEACGWHRRRPKL